MQQNLNSINDFLMSLVMSYVGSWFKLLRISWYRIMKPFVTNLKLVINKYLCRLNESFPGVDFYSNFFVSIEISKYISSYNLNSITFDFYICSLNSDFMCDINEFVNWIWFNRCIWFWLIGWIFWKNWCVPDFTSGYYVYFK